MLNKVACILICALLLGSTLFSQDEILKINTSINPGRIKQGEEGVLKIKITPKEGIKISSYLGFMIELEENPNLSFPKVFFTASELDLQSKEENDTVFLKLEKEIPIPFKLNDHSLIGKHEIKGKVSFTAISDKDKWSLKTYQRFVASFVSRRNPKIK